MLVLTAGLHAWQGPVLLLWLSAAAAVCTRPGERLAVLTLAFRRPTKRQWQILGPVSQAALEWAELPADQIDWYVRAGSRPNACVAGRRSVAVTDGALESFLAGRLSHDQLRAVLLHELGHLTDGASSFGLTVWWLANPGRVAFRLVLRVSMALTGHRRWRRGNRFLALIAGVIALAQDIQHAQWVAAAMLMGLAAAVIGTPVVDAALNRQAERAADRYAAGLGAGEDLASALLALGGNLPDGSRWPTRLLDDHPSIASRIEALTARVERPPRP